MALVDGVLRAAQRFFQEGIQRGLPDIERWVREFLTAFSVVLDFFASIVKQFKPEREHRIAKHFQDTEQAALIFKQKHTLLARHLPLDFTIGQGSQKRLPITRIYVGPGPAQRVSQVSVGDLLRVSGYDDDKVSVEISKIPYRIP
jgi:hypothetical protein